MPGWTDHQHAPTFAFQFNDFGPSRSQAQCHGWLACNIMVTPALIMGCSACVDSLRAFQCIPIERTSAACTQQTASSVSQPCTCMHAVECMTLRRSHAWQDLQRKAHARKQPTVQSHNDLDLQDGCANMRISQDCRKSRSLLICRKAVHKPKIWQFCQAALASGRTKKMYKT